MKTNNRKKGLSNEKGVTMVSLLVTVFVMMFIVVVAVDVGTDSVDSTRLKAFYTQLEIVQKRVDDIATTNEGYYINNNGTQTYLDIQTAGGNAITSSQATFLQGILNAEGITTIPASEFRYFTVANLEEQFDLSEIEHNVFIHFGSRTIVSEKGVKANGNTYYVLKNNIYFANQDTTKNEGALKLIYNITKYGTNNYKIIVTPTTVGDLIANGTLKYKKTTTKYWETANGLEIVISNLGEYNIEYVDINKNTVLQTITVALDENANPTVTVKE